MSAKPSRGEQVLALVDSCGIPLLRWQREVLRITIDAEGPFFSSAAGPGDPRPSENPARSVPGESSRCRNCSLAIESLPPDAAAYGGAPWRHVDTQLVGCRSGLDNHGRGDRAEPDTRAMPNGTEREGEHWNARLIREQAAGPLRCAHETVSDVGRCDNCGSWLTLTMPREGDAK